MSLANSVGHALEKALTVSTFSLLAYACVAPKIPNENRFVYRASVPQSIVVGVVWLACVMVTVYK